MQDKKNLVLVGVVNRRKDLEIARHQHWYRIPIKYAPKRKAKFLALYQTRIFGKEGKCIDCYAPIQHWSLVSRVELLPEEKDHPHANRSYYKLQLGALRKLPGKIKNTSRRRMNFGFTTLAKLFKCREVSRLFGIRPLEVIMEKLLRRNKIQAVNEYVLTENGRRRYCLDFAIFCRKGKIDVECDNEKWHALPSQKRKDEKRDLYLKKRGWTVLRFEGKKIMDNPDSCIKTLNKSIRKSGGLLTLIH